MKNKIFYSVYPQFLEGIGTLNGGKKASIISSLAKDMILNKFPERDKYLIGSGTREELEDVKI